MRTSIYFSAVLGITFLTIRFVGLFLDFSNKELFLWLGLGFLVLVTLPLSITEHLRYKKKKRTILKSFHKEDKSEKLKKSKTSNNPDYPSFRKQRRGLTWGGGNIHGSSAKRGAKRGFLKH